MDIRAVAADDDRGILLAPEVGHEIFDLHGADEETFDDAVGLVMGGDDLAAEAVGQVRDLDGAHEGVLGDDAEHPDAPVAQEGGDQGLGFLQEVLGHVVEDHAGQAVAELLPEDEQVIVVEFLRVAVDDHGLEAELAHDPHAVGVAVAAGMHAAGAADDGHVLAGADLVVGRPDGIHDIADLVLEGLDLEIMGGDDGSEGFGLLVCPKNALDMVGVVVPEAAVDFPGHGPHGFHVAHAVAFLLETKAKSHDDHVLAGISGRRANIQSNHDALPCASRAGEPAGKYPPPP